MTSGTQKTEIVAFASGKGGTGKTLMAACLAYALIRGGQSVLLVDADPATDGLSLFLLGPKGTKQIDSFEPTNTFTGILTQFQTIGSLVYEPHPIHRANADDHGVSYEAIISGRGLYGDDPGLGLKPAVPDLDQSSFRAGVRSLFDSLRSSQQYSYVIVDTRGGFAFESTDVCALADSFIIVTDPDFTSFYQDRNLMRRINRAAEEVSSSSLLRAMIVNRAIDIEQGSSHIDLSKIEVSFRNELTKEFPISFDQTYPVPADLQALIAYKTQKIPYVSAPASPFSFATLTAFSDILGIVTSKWSAGQVGKWNELITTVSNAVEDANREKQKRVEQGHARERQVELLEKEVAIASKRAEELQREMDRMERAYERELERSNLLLKGGVTKPTRGDVDSRNRRVLVYSLAGAILFVLFALIVLWLRQKEATRANEMKLHELQLQMATPPSSDTAGRIDSIEGAVPMARAIQVSGAKNAKGKQIYDFQCWLDLTRLSQSQRDQIQSVSYAFNDPTIFDKIKVSSQASNGFAVGYRGWGAFHSVPITVTFKDGKKSTLTFDMFTAIGW
jgi:MinD-like ATPase involved in chromosome partitioning or flagellar assembly